MVWFQSAQYRNLHEIDIKYPSLLAKIMRSGVEKVKNKDKVALLILAALLFLFFNRIIFLPQTYFLGDIMNYFQPWTAFAAEGLHKGLCYLWNPYLANGEPFLANIQVAVFYPLKIFFYLFPFFLAFKLYLLLHFFLGGVFLFLFLRQGRCSTFASLVGSAVFTFSGFMLVQIEFFSVLGSLIWFSAIWVLFRKAISENSRAYYIAAGLGLALMFFAGYTFIFYYTNVFLVLYLLWLRTGTARLLWMWGIMSGLIAIQLLPTYELMPLCIRSVWTAAEANTWSLAPLFLIKFILPDLFGKICVPALFYQPFETTYYAIQQYWLSTFYLGITPLLFLLFSRREKKEGYFWELLAGLALILSMSSTFPVTRFYYEYFPLAKKFTHPASFMFFFLFALIIFIARGIDSFLKSDPALFRRRLAMALLTAAGMYAAVYILFLQKQWFIALVEQWFHYPLNPKQLGWLETNFFEFSVITMAGGLLVWGWSRQKSNPRWLALVFGFIVVDLFLFGWKINPVAKNDFFSRPLNTINVVRKNLTGGRIFFEPEAQMNRPLQGTDTESDYFGLRYTLLPNAGLPYHVPYVYEYGYLTLRDYKNLLLQAKGRPSIMDSRIIDMLGGELVFSYNPLIHPKLRWLYADLVNIYRNTGSMPKAWLVGKETILSRELMPAYLAGDKFNPETEVVFAPGMAQPQLLKSRTDPTAIVHYAQSGSDRLDITVQNSSGNWLVINDVFYPGWKAWIDHKQTPVREANYVLKAVFVPAGDHQISLQYRPAAFYLGMALTVTLLVLLSITAILRVRRLYGI